MPSCRRHFFPPWLSKCLRDEVVHTFKVYIGEPPASCTTFRRHAVAMNVKRDEKMLRNIINLSVLPNGDWHNHHEVQCYLPAGSAVDEKELALTFAERMDEALLPGLFGLMSKDFFCQIAALLQMSARRRPWARVRSFIPIEYSPDRSPILYVCDVVAAHACVKRTACIMSHVMCFRKQQGCACCSKLQTCEFPECKCWLCTRLRVLSTVSSRLDSR